MLEVIRDAQIPERASIPSKTKQLILNYISPEESYTDYANRNMVHLLQFKFEANNELHLGISQTICIFQTILKKFES